MNRIINGAHRDCRKYIKDLRAAIEAATDAVAGIDDMLAEMPNPDCEAAAIAHRENIAAQSDQLMDMVDSFKTTCDNLTNCLSNGGITVQDGGGK